MTCIITDDEQNSRETLRYLLAAISPETIILAEANNAEQAKKYIEKLKPDLLFLDINMPGQSGIEFLEANGTMGCQVIFTTAYNEFAVKAFRLNAIDFLLKPIDPDELEAALEKAKNQPVTLDRTQIQSAQNYLQNKDNNALKRLALPTQEGVHFVDLDMIVYLESMGSYTKFVIENQKVIVVSKVLKDYEDLLCADYPFLRVHQSNLVNLRHIRKYVKGDGGQLWMSDGTEIEVSRRKKDELLEALKGMAI
jgi:two-component system, LytTR family, response regulator